MLRRSVLRLSAGKSVKRVPIETTTQVPSYLLSRREFSVSPKQNGPHRPGSTSKPPETGSIFPKFIVGSVALGAAFMAAYQTGYLDKYLVTEQQAPPELATSGTAFQDPKEPSETLGKPVAESEFLESDVSTGNKKHVDESTETRPDLSELERSSKTESESQFQAKDSSEITAGEAIHTEVKDLPPSSLQSSAISDETTLASQPPKDSLDTKSPEVIPDAVQHEAIEITPTLKQADTVQRENEANTLPTEHVTSLTKIEDVHHNDEKPSTLLDEYHLRDEGGATTTTSPDRHQVIEDLGDAYISKDGKLVLDFLDAIHEAERRQAEIDARTFSEHKRNIKEKYEKELKDARVRELMYAEREALLDKELKRERAKAIAAVKSLQENLEEKHRMELEEKENEAELNLKKAQELAKAELAAAIASEKASQIEKMAEANININALCMAFYARSEEARQSHSVHKLALGALALEDAVSRGLPIHKEIEVLHTSLEGIDNDSLLELALSSLPEETRKYGSDTMLQLNRKFDALKGTLRHFSLIPPGGGGILTHSLARVACWLKVREADQSGDGIESLINRVESFLAQGKLSEAADALEKGVNGTQAAAVVDDWVKRARNRAITEQALTLLQSYATTVNLT